MIIIFYWKIDLCKMQYITLKKRKKVLFSFLDTLCDFYGWFHGGSTWGGRGGGHVPPNNFAKLSYKGPLFSSSTWKIWTFMRDFLKKLDLNLKKCDPLRAIFWKKWTFTWEMWTFTHDFLKKVDLDLKMWTFYAWFSEKGGPQPEKCGSLRMIFWKKWTSTWKCGPFTHDFLKKVDLNLKNVDLYA